MTVPQKILLSFMLSVFLFVGIAMLAYTGFMDIIESRFYNPAVTAVLVRETARDAKILGERLSELQNRFLGLLHSQPVRRSFLSSPGVADISERSIVFGSLLESMPGLQSVRFIDADGMRIHFSTVVQDIVAVDSVSVIYRDYHDVPGHLPFHAVFAREHAKLIPDTAGDRIIFSFPFKDSLDHYLGVALFTVSANVLRNAGPDQLALCAYPKGIVAGVPARYSEEILAGVCASWAEGYRSIVPFLSSDVMFALVSVRMNHGFYYGRIVHEAVFVFPQQVKILTLTAIFLTLFLVIFFFCNMRRDSRVHHGDTGTKIRVTAGNDEELEELEAVKEVKQGSGLLAAAAFLAASAKDDKVIYEHNGIPYIKNHAFNVSKSLEAQLDNNFVKLIEAVVKKPGASA